MEASGAQSADSAQQPSNPLIQQDSDPAAASSNTASELTHFANLSASPDTACTLDAEARPQQQVELTYLSDCGPSGRGSDSPPAKSSRQFNRTNSYTAINRFASGATTRSNSLAEVQQLESCADEAGRQATRLMQRCSFEVFEMEEQEATEVKYLRGALSKKEEECEHLRAIIKELSNSRARVHKTKVELEEQYTALQRQYFRVAKVAELARAASQASTSTSGRAKQELAETKAQLARSQRVAEAAKDKARLLRLEVADLKRQLACAEAGRAADDCRQSASMREYAWRQCVFLV